MSIFPASSEISIDDRVRWFRLSIELQTSQSQPMSGTPVDVPDPRIVTRTFFSETAMTDL